MSYRIGPVKLRNFGPFAEAEFDFSRPGLTVIEGEFHGHGCDSNGSGKSYALEAPVWCVFGVPLRPRVKKGGVVRLQFERRGGQLVPTDPHPDGCSVETHLVGGPKPIKIVRYEGHPTHGNRVRLFIDGSDVTLGRDSMTQTAIEQAIGHDFRSFVNSVAFGATDEARSFFAATDAERKAIMDRVIGLEVYTRAGEVARARLREVQASIATRRARSETMQETLVAQERLAAEVSSEHEQESRAWKAKLARARVVVLTRHAARLERHSSKRHQKLEHEAERYQEAERTHERAARDVERRRRALDARCRAAECAIVEAETEMASVNRRVAKWDALAGQRCATCMQVIAPNIAKDLRREAVEERKKHEAVVEDRTKELDGLRGEMRTLTDPSRPDSTAYTSAKDRARRALEALRRARQEESAAKLHAAHIVEEWTAFQHRAAKVQGEVDKAKFEVAKLTREIGENVTREEHLQFWTEGFGNAGIKSFLIEGEIPIINRIASGYAQRLLGVGSRVRLSATRELKSGESREELAVEALIPGCTASYATSSKGQKKRLDLCLLLAFRQVVSSRSAKSFEQFFADELFDGLDETGEECVVELLRDLAHVCPVILVTHSSRLKSIGDRVIRVVHQDGVSAVGSAPRRAGVRTKSTV